MTTEHGPLILVVDDYQDAREMCANTAVLRLSRRRGRTGTRRWRRRARWPDLILMDLSLPGMDGWEATRVLKADEATKHIPIVALTGHALAGASEGAARRDATRSSPSVSA